MFMFSFWCVCCNFFVLGFVINVVVNKLYKGVVIVGEFSLFNIIDI